MGDLVSLPPPSASFLTEPSNPLTCSEENASCERVKNGEESVAVPVPPSIPTNFKFCYDTLAKLCKNDNQIPSQAGIEKCRNLEKEKKLPRPPSNKNPLAAHLSNIQFFVGQFFDASFDFMTFAGRLLLATPLCQYEDEAFPEAYPKGALIPPKEGDYNWDDEDPSKIELTPPATGLEENTLLFLEPCTWKSLKVLEGYYVEAGSGILHRTADGLPVLETSEKWKELGGEPFFGVLHPEENRFEIIEIPGVAFSFASGIGFLDSRPIVIKNSPAARSLAAAGPALLSLGIFLRETAWAVP